MSEQMEKNIIKILDKLNNQEKILRKHDEKLEKLEKLEKNQEEFRKELIQQGEKLDYVSKELTQQGEKLDYVSKELTQQGNKLNYVSEDLRNFSRHFAVFETDFGLKVDVLFEKYDTDYREHKTFKRDIDSLKDDSFKHGVQIEHLSKKVATA